MTPPLVTIGMALYNGETFVRNAIMSVLRGSYRNLEVLVVNDGSTDKSVDIVSSIPDSRIRIVNNSRNQGLVAVRNRIMDEAKGSYIAWLDQDDIAYPDRICSQVSLLEEHPDVGACGSGTIYRTHESSGEEWLRRVPMPVHHDLIRASMPFFNPLSFNTVTMRLNVFREKRLEFRHPYGNCLDYDMWSRAVEHMRLCNLPRFLGEYRLHASQTSRGEAAGEMSDNAWRVQSDVLERQLGIQFKTESSLTNHVHRQMTNSPWSIQSLDEVHAVGAWLGHLVVVNSQKGVYVDEAFKQAAARQWARVLWYSQPRIGLLATFGTAAMSQKLTRLPLNALFHGGSAALQGKSDGMKRHSKMFRRVQARKVV